MPKLYTQEEVDKLLAEKLASVRTKDLTDGENQKPIGIIDDDGFACGYEIEGGKLPSGTKIYAKPVSNRIVDIPDDELERVWFSTGNSNLADSLRAVIAADREKNK